MLGRRKPADKKPADKKSSSQPASDEPEIEQVLFQGPLFGREANLKAHAKLVQSGLLPVKMMISDALSRRAHTILLEPRENRLTIRFIIDGTPYPVAALPAPKGAAMLQMTKLLAGLDPLKRRDNQEGGIKAEYNGVPYHLMVDCVPQKTGGERIRIKVENRKVIRSRPADVGLPTSVRNRVREYTSERSGVILICGPPESGSTTLSVVTLHSVDPYLYSVFNMAHLPGVELTNVSDFEPEPGHDLELSFDRLQRREADVIFLDRLEDPHVVQTVFDYSDKLAFVAEIRASTPIEAVQQLIDWIGPDAVIRGLRAVLTQKLVRRLCDDCKQAFRPSPPLLKRLGLPPETSVLYRAPAPPPPDDPQAQSIEELCEKCDGSPYYGRVALFEMLEMSEGMKEVIAEGADPAAMRKQMVADNMLTLQKDALRVVVEGSTSLEEVQRAFNPGGARKRPAKQRPRPKSE